jgi:hypothetical protein
MPPENWPSPAVSNEIDPLEMSNFAPVAQQKPNEVAGYRLQVAGCELAK